MFNCGVDFGSTYTTISRFREEYERLEIMTMGEAIPYIPSVASLRNNHWKFGTAAKATTGQSNTRTFKAFKMLLSETDQKKLTDRGYTDEYTPAAVAKEFLMNQITKAASSAGENEIGKLVVGAPEIWFKKVETVDGRNVLRDICREINKKMEIKEVQIVSEPAAACAYFAHNFEAIKKRNYEGTILLVDYGGGTLDISLSKVTTEQSDGHSYMEIRVIESNGAGEGVDKEIGQAGIVYMEKVMEAAIMKSNGGTVPVRDSKFYKAVNELELALQSEGELIEEIFNDCGIDNIEELEEEEFTAILYKGEEVVITFAALVEIYNEVIRGVLNDKLQEMRTFMRSYGINDMDKNQEDFKIAIVGGFGNFYLVRRQVEEIFRFSTHDRRTESIIVDKSDCEKAVSYGAALIASDQIRIRQTAPYSIGLYQTDVDGRPCLDYAFRYREDIEFNTPYFPIDKNTGEMIPTFIAEDTIDKFVYNPERNKETALVLPLKAEIKKRLTNVVKNRYRTAVIGFSMDSSEVVSIHIKEYDLLTNEVSKEDHVIELTRYNDMFESTRVKKVLDM